MSEGASGMIEQRDETERQKIFRQLSQIATTLKSADSRSVHLSRIQESALLGTGLELALAFYGSGASWFGRYSRVRLTKSLDETKGKDLIFFLRTDEAGEEFILAADATVGFDSLKKKIKGDKQIATKNTGGRIRMTGLNQYIPDQLSSLYSNTQPKTSSYTHHNETAIHRVPQVIVTMSPATVRELFANPTSSLKFFQENPVQLRFQEQLYVQIQSLLHDPRYLHTDNSDYVIRNVLLKKIASAIAKIYADTYRTIPPEKRDAFFDDKTHQRLLRLVSGQSPEDAVSGLRAYAEKFPDVPKQSGEVSLPIAKRDNSF